MHYFAFFELFVKILILKIFLTQKSFEKQIDGREKTPKLPDLEVASTFADEHLLHFQIIFFLDICGSIKNPKFSDGGFILNLFFKKKNFLFEG